jgi:putative membrane protein
VKIAAVIGLIAGLFLTVMFVLANGAGQIWRSATLLGWSGFLAVLLFHLCLIAGMGSGWWLLGRGREDISLKRCVWGRLIRDSAAEALPLSQIGGFVVGARAITLAGVSSAFAAASTVVDVTVELVAQLGYTLLGLLLLSLVRPDNAFAGPGLAGLSAMAILASIFIAVQARGAGFVEQAGQRLARQFLGGRIGASGAVQAQIRALHRRRAALAGATCVHLACWLLSGVETWGTLRLMQVRLSLADGLIIDSLLYGMRSIAFMVPNAFGVQEGGLVILGAMFGVGADTALALSLIKRARDLTIGVPALLTWQALEGRRVWGRALRKEGVLF